MEDCDLHDRELTRSVMKKKFSEIQENSEILELKMH